MGVVCVVFFCLDEDCNPGWGDCGRPLRHLGYVDGAIEEIFVQWRLDWRSINAWSKKESLFDGHVGTQESKLFLEKVMIAI